MNVRSKFVSRAVLVTVGVIGTASTALADKPYWANGHERHDRYRQDYRQSEYARVIDVDPIVRRVRVSSPAQECWTEDRPVYGGGHTIARSTVVGGLIGAAAGNHIALHQGLRDPGTVIVGSLIGAAIGNSIGEDRAERRGEYRQAGYETVQRCQVSARDQWEERIDGYRVTYIYNGCHYTTQLPYDPGQRVRVDVDVRPEYDRSQYDSQDD